MTRKPDAPWLLDFLSLIRGRPGMYLGSEEVTGLRLWLDGYRSARADLGLPEMCSTEQSLWDGFQPWLKQRLGISETYNGGWNHMIEEEYLKAPTAHPQRLARSKTDGSAYLFFELFGEYLREEGKEYGDSTAILIAGGIAGYKAMKNENDF